LTPEESLPTVSMILVVHNDWRTSPKIFNKFEMTLMLFSGAWVKMIHKKTEGKNLVTLSI
jgi:hypothetical protein